MSLKAPSMFVYRLDLTSGVEIPSKSVGGEKPATALLMFNGFTDLKLLLTIGTGLSFMVRFKEFRLRIELLSKLAPT
jgi:hypothetical protein